MSRSAVAAVAALAAGIAVGAAPAQPRPPVVDVSISTPVISPNGDRVRDRTRITVTVHVPATLSVTVHRAHGPTLAKLASGLALAPGRVDFVWNGRFETGRARDGVYTVLARAVDSAGLESEKHARVVVDTRRPRISWLGPWARRVRGRVLPLDFATADGASRQVWLELGLYDQTGERRAGFAPSPRPTGRLRLGWHPRSGLPPGAYRVTVTATDAAGNSRTAPPRPFLIERGVVARTLARFDGVGRRVALTFDDCTSPSAWARILATLRAHGAQAGFFCSSPYVLAAPDVARRTLRDGHTIGSHGWDHANFALLPYSSALSRLVSDREVWWRLAKASPTPFFRPPYGEYGRAAVAAAGRAGYSAVVLWDVDPSDWRRPGADAIAARVLGAVRAGSVVLLHVTWQTALALPAILRGLRSRRLTPAALDDLARRGRFDPGHWPSYHTGAAASANQVFSSGAIGRW